MKSEDTNAPVHLLAGERHDTPSSLDAFRERVASGAVKEAWVRSNVVDLGYNTNGDILLGLVPADGPSAMEEVRCILPQVVQSRVQARHGAMLVWQELIGSTLCLQIQAVKGGSWDITDVEPDWVESTVRACARLCLRDLEMSNLLGAQQRLFDPAQVRRICIVCDPDDPTWPATRRELDGLANEGVAYVVEPSRFEGCVGVLSLQFAFRRALAHAVSGEVDLVLVLHDEPLCEGNFGLQTAELSALVCQIPVPVILGLKRPPCGSVLHQVSFAGLESSQEALHLVRGLIRSAQEAETKQKALDCWEERCEGRRVTRIAASAGAAAR